MTSPQPEDRCTFCAFPRARCESLRERDTLHQPCCVNCSHELDGPTVAEARPKPLPVCSCTAAHQPRPLTVDHHHIKPESWGGLYTDTNIIVVCPTTHHSIHTLIDLYVTLGRKPTTGEQTARFGFLPSRFIRKYAAAAWAVRPPVPTRTSIHAWHPLP